jgi:ATP-dependent Lhr-like helicase
MSITDSPGYLKIKEWFAGKDWQPFPFQEECWQSYLEGKNGLLNAPTGSGKTYALWMPLLIEWINDHPKDYEVKTNNGLQLLWITPLRALTRDIQKAMLSAAWDMNIPWLIKVRTGDTSSSDKALIRKTLPEVLITTPESLHLMLAQKDYPKTFRNLKAVVVDEWHELLGSKRGVQVELALSRLRAVNSSFRTWGISATIGNLDQAKRILMPERANKESVIVRSDSEKNLTIRTIIPEKVEKLPWAGHMGLKLIPHLLPILEESQTTLIFINTRGQTETWYKTLLDNYPALAGTIAIHHGSLDRELRNWVEEAIHDEKLKVVVCTSSLDLGVDFAPVETVVQVGSPKSVARFLQRAGRSGHRPGAESRLYFLPTHALELLESAALQQAVHEHIIEDRPPMQMSFDVLIQYLVTLAVSDGFEEKPLFDEIKSTYAYRDLEREEWEWMLDFITTGGSSLEQYDEYHKVVIEDGRYKVTSRRVAMQHRLSIGTIVSESLLRVQIMHGGNIGYIEEPFIAKLNPGDVFWFAGRALELVKVREMTAYVKKSKAKSGIIPSFLGARLSLSPLLAGTIRKKLQAYIDGQREQPEIARLQPLLELQAYRSHIPGENEMLIECIQTDDGFHTFIYPFAGRSLHEGLAALVAYRLSRLSPITFSLAMNDYGLELLSDKQPDIKAALATDLFSVKNLHEELQQSINATELARRRFREIAQISGLLFTGYPGKNKRSRHLQSSSSLLFDVFRDFDPGNLLIEQSFHEVYEYLLHEDRLYHLLKDIGNRKIIATYPEKPTPFAFPIMVDRMRETVTSEKFEDRIKRMQVVYGE